MSIVDSLLQVLELCLKYLRNQKQKASAGSDSDADSILDELSDKSGAEVEDKKLKNQVGNLVNCLTVIF